MRVRITVPQIGEAVAELTLVEWHCGEGERVRKGEPLFSVDSEKSIVDVEAWDDGVLARILVPAGSAVMPNDAVGELETAGPAAGPAPQAAAAAAPEPQPAAPRGPGRPAADRRAASPRARRLARERGLPLEGLRGTGVRGMVTAADVLGAARAGAGRDLRRVIAERTARSKREVPHYYLSVEVDFAAVRDARARAQPSAPGITSFIVKACGRALREHPQCNVCWREGRSEPLPDVAIGVAVEVPGGILVATVHDPDSLTLPELDRRLAAAVDGARAGRVGERGERGEHGEHAARSMVVSNLGMFGVDEFHAIIDPPDPMILAVAAVRDRVVAVAGAPAVRPTALLSLSADHRVLDGAPAARFLARVRALLEAPEELA